MDLTTSSNTRLIQNQGLSETSHSTVLRTYENALRFTLLHEGGINSDPRDPGNINGSVTAYGITQSTYDEWRRNLSQSKSTKNVANISSGEVHELYFEEYFLPVRGDEVSPKLALVLFDTSVNLGPRKTIQLLQASVNVKQDGIFGSRTLRAVRSNKESSLLNSLIGRREIFYRELSRSPKYKPFLAGWLNRTAALRKAVQ